MFAGVMTLVQMVEHNYCMKVELEDQVMIIKEEVVIHSAYHWTQTSTGQSVEHRVMPLCMERNMNRQTH